MLEKLSLLAIGGMLIIGGVYTLIFRAFTSWKYGYVDMGAYHSVIGAIFLIVGLLAICVAARSIIKDKKKERSAQEKNPVNQR